MSAVSRPGDPSDLTDVEIEAWKSNQGAISSIGTLVCSCCFAGRDPVADTAVYGICGTYGYAVPESRESSAQGKVLTFQSI